jgi:type II secretory pathway pseudopilin PulG
MKQRGFTAVELIAAIILLVALGSLFWVQKSNLEARDRDTTRKIAVNAIYYNLEDIFYTKNGYYPQTLVSTQLIGLDPAMLKDPAGKLISQPGATYNYESQGCTAAKCTSYTLRANLEREADFVKQSRNH